MVKETVKNNNKYYVCEECSFAYKDKRWAQKCQNWCKKYNSCNIEITKYAVKID